MGVVRFAAYGARTYSMGEQMPDRVEVRAAKNGARDFIEVPTADEQLLQAYADERAGYVRRLERGEERYGNEDINMIISKIDSEIIRLGGSVKHEDFMQHTVTPTAMVGESGPEIMPERLIGQTVLPPRSTKVRRGEA